MQNKLREIVVQLDALQTKADGYEASDNERNGLLAEAEAILLPWQVVFRTEKTLPAFMAKYSAEINAALLAEINAGYTVSKKKARPSKR